MSEQRPFRRKVYLLSPEFPSYGIAGSRGAGKSSFLEFTMEWYKRHGYLCLDLFASIDGEGAYWAIGDSVAIGRWSKLESDDSSKLIEYIKAWCKLKSETNFQVHRVDERTIYCTTDNFTFKLRLDKTLHAGYFYVHADNPFARKYLIIAYKNNDGELVVHGKNPDRHDKERARLNGYPVLIILPKTTVIKQRNPLCRCGIPLNEHDALGWQCKRGMMPLIRTVTDDVPLKEIIAIAADEKRVVVFNRGFYEDQRDAYRSLARLLKEMPFLILRGTLPKNQCYCIGMRETGMIAPSGLKGMRGDYETQTKRELQTYIREARHLRTVLCLDFQRSSDIAKSIASQRDFLFIKRSTKDLIPDDYLWLFDLIENKKAFAKENLDFDDEDNWPSIPKLKPWEAYVLFPDRHFELRTHSLPTFRHKRPNDSWAIDANCDIEYLQKKDLDKDGIQKKITSLSKRKEEKAKQDEVLKEADKLHEDGATWTDLAKKYGWLDKTTGLPSGDRLKMAVRRWKERQESQGNNGTS